MKSHFYYFLSILLVIGNFSCQVNTDNQHNTPIIDFADSTQTFHYFANGHLEKEKYPFTVVEKDGQKAGEIIRASDASVWSGMYSNLDIPLQITNGKQFSVDVWMDHIGSFTLKLENSSDGGPNTAISVKNTKINQWERLLFDFSDAIFGLPTYQKIAVFCDLNSSPTGKDVTGYFANIVQLAPKQKETIIGDKDSAIKIVVLGSSTAAGTGPLETGNAWVNRYRRKMHELNGHNQVINLAVGGYTTYHLLPNGSIIKNDRPKPDSFHNVTKALSLNPDAIIINLPSNDANSGYPVDEQIANYRILQKFISEKNIPLWVSTPQGRNMSNEKRAVQRIMVDSTYAIFGRKTFDVWTDLAHWNGQINSKYDCGDGIHLNDEGHQLLFAEVWQKDILGYIENKRKQIKTTSPSYTTDLQRAGYDLIWQDEFNGAMLDTAIWAHELGNGCPDLCGWGNNEKVWYRPENSTVRNGHLIITAKTDHEQKGYWSSSRIITKNKQEFLFGRIDVRAKLPETKGLWPAIWLLGANQQDVGWPACGEIDIMEEVGHIPYRVRGTLHYLGVDGAALYKGDKYEIQHGKFSDSFHVYSIEWTDIEIKFLVDDQVFTVRTFDELDRLDKETNPFHKPFYMILNLAVGGNLPGDPDASSIFPQTFEIDYVRYYQKSTIE